MRPPLPPGEKEKQSESPEKKLTKDSCEALAKDLKLGSEEKPEARPVWEDLKTRAAGRQRSPSPVPDAS